jgi:hypothetical protein
MPISPHPQYGHPYWAIWPISLQHCSVIVLLDIKANGERKEALIARFDHRPMLTATLALATIVLLVVVITLATLLITAAPPAAPAPSGSVGDKPPAMVPSEHYGHDLDQPEPAPTGNGADSAVARHAEMVAAYNAKR